jgi:hypothetical protein
VRFRKALNARGALLQKFVILPLGFQPQTGSVAFLLETGDGGSWAGIGLKAGIRID